MLSSFASFLIVLLRNQLKNLISKSSLEVKDLLQSRGSMTLKKQVPR